MHFFFFFLHFKSFSFDSHDLNGLGRKLWVVNVTVSLHNTSNSSKYQEESCSPWYAKNTRPEGIHFFYSQSFALLGEGFDCDGLYLHNCVCKRGFYRSTCSAGAIADYRWLQHGKSAYGLHQRDQFKHYSSRLTRFSAWGYVHW